MNFCDDDAWRRRLHDNYWHEKLTAVKKNCRAAACDVFSHYYRYIFLYHFFLCCNKKVHRIKYRLLWSTEEATSCSSKIHNTWNKREYNQCKFHKKNPWNITFIEFVPHIIFTSYKCREKNTAYSLSSLTFQVGSKWEVLWGWLQNLKNKNSLKLPFGALSWWGCFEKTVKNCLKVVFFPNSTTLSVMARLSCC